MRNANDAWDRALALEREDRLDEAVTALRSQSAYWQSQAAHLYQLRAERLARQGHADAAKEAANESLRWMREYASGATSGSEGAMYTEQLAKLERELARMLKRR